jgi:hypothetical protein
MKNNSIDKLKLSVLICVLASSLANARAALATPPTFAAPPIQSVAGNEVGRTGINSMAKGDFNGDGIPDIAVTGFACSNGQGYPQNSIAVYIGNGDGTFKAPVYYQGGPCPYEVVVGHVRGNNTPEDLVVVDAGQGNNITVLLGNGDGTFQAPITAASFIGGITAVAIADFNGDAKPDLAVAAWGGSGETGGNLNTVAILLGNGDGTFQAPTHFVSLNNPYAIAVGDFNNDGKIDIVLMNPEGLYLSRGNGDGTFLPASIILEEPSTLISVNPPGPILNGPVSFLVADFNDDGNLDIAADIDGARIDVLLGTGTGNFALTPPYLITAHEIGFGGGQIATAKLTNSGKLDLVIATGYGGTAVILKGNGDGIFQSPIIYPLPEYNDASLILADVNGDGQIDIVTGSQGGSLNGDPNYLTVLLNRGNGNFGALPPLFSVIAAGYNNADPTNPVGVELADLTGNGKLDVITTNFTLPAEPLTNGQVPTPPTINTTTNQVDTHGSISVLTGNGDGTFQNEKQFYVGGRPLAVKAGDLTGDGKRDLAVVNAFSNTLSILKGNGDRTFQAAITIPVGTNPTSLVIADFNGDGKPDIALTNLVDNNVSVLINQSVPGSLNFKTPVTYALGVHPAAIIARDFNHDGIVDLAVVNAGDPFGTNKDTTLSILKGNGDGTFQPAATQVLWGGTNGSGGDAIAAGDFGTGQVDLAVANFAYNEVMILHGSGDGTFTPAGKYSVGAGPEGIAAIDSNGDGKTDLAVNNLNDGTVALLVGNGDGTFIPVANKYTDDIARPFGWSAWGYPAFMAAGDLNGDGKPDLVVSNLFEAAVTVLRNTTITPPVQLVSIVSRKVHGPAGATTPYFDIDLPLTGSPGIECRGVGGTTNTYQIIYTFNRNVGVAGTVTKIQGNATVGQATIGPNPDQVTVNLTDVNTAQYLTLKLDGMQDTVGTILNNSTARVGILVGDVNINGRVSNSDVSSIQSQVGAPVGQSNFRMDVNANGTLSNADAATAQAQVGAQLP